MQPLGEILPLPPSKCNHVITLFLPHSKGITILLNLGLVNIPHIRERLIVEEAN